MIVFLSIYIHCTYNYRHIGFEVEASGGDAEVCLGRSFTFMAEKYLHYLGVSQGGEVTQVVLVTCNLPQDSPHYLP